jgi:hypothetical protein
MGGLCFEFLLLGSKRFDLQVLVARSVDVDSYVARDWACAGPHWSYEGHMKSLPRMFSVSQKIVIVDSEQNEHFCCRRSTIDLSATNQAARSHLASPFRRVSNPVASRFRLAGATVTGPESSSIRS